jgi:hypothetical protein
VLADFNAEWTKTRMPPATVTKEYWMMYLDGSLVKEGAGLGFIFVSPFGMRMRYVVRAHFPAANNVAEYEALINGLHITWLHIAKRSVGWRTSLMVSNLTKTQGGAMKQLTCWQKWHRAASPSRLASLLEISTSPRSVMRRRNRPGPNRLPQTWGLANHRPFPTMRSWSSTLN